MSEVNKAHILHRGCINVWWVNYRCSISSSHPGRGAHSKINHRASPPTLFLFVSVYVCHPLLFSAGRNVGPRGPPGPGPAPNFNRSTEDLRMKQQPAPNYGRLRESNCVILVSLFVCFPSSFLPQADFSTPVVHPPRQPVPPSSVLFPSPVFLRLTPAASPPPRLLLSHRWVQRSFCLPSTLLHRDSVTLSFFKL